MGFWKFNPAEPCCNPPAGYCQCQPCRWRIVEIVQGAEPFIYFGEDASEQDYFEDVGLPRAMRGYTNHHEWLCKGLVSFRPKPWHRLWHIEFTFAGLEYSWAFGYGRWFIPGATAIDAPLLNRIGWGFCVTDDPAHDHGFEPWEGLTGGLSGNSDTPLWMHVNGHHGAWNCWGENKLIFVGDLSSDDPTRYVVVEPDL